MGAEEGGGAGAGFTTLGGGVGGFSSFSEDSGAYSCPCSGYKIINNIVNDIEGK